MNKRQEVLDAAIQAVCKERAETYGAVEDSFTNIAGLWNAYADLSLTPHQVCMMMLLLKVARSKHNQEYMDNYTDAAGYAACAAEIAK